jgi:hypothetical protein
MKAKIEVSRTAAALAGLDNEGDYIISFGPSELTQAQREELVRCETDRETGAFKINQNFSVNGRMVGGLPPVAVANIQALCELLDARISRRAEHLAKEEAERVEKEDKKCEAALAWASQPVEERIRSSWGARSTTRWEIDSYPVAGDKKLLATVAPEAYEEARSLCLWKNIGEMLDEMKGEKAKAAAEAERAAAKQRRQNQIAAWVADKGTPNQKARLEAGLLPEDEILDAMRDEAFAPLAEIERYIKIKASDFCECEYDSDKKFDVWNADTATAAEFERLSEIKKLMPAATVTLRTHYGRCSLCDTQVTRSGIRVHIKIGEIEFSREYAV